MIKRLRHRSRQRADEDRDLMLDTLSARQLAELDREVRLT